MKKSLLLLLLPSIVFAQDLIADDWPEIQGYRKHNFALYWFPKVKIRIWHEKTTSKSQEFNPVEILTFSPYTGVFYGNKFSFGFEVTGLIIDDSVTPYFTPLVRLKL